MRSVSYLLLLSGMLGWTANSAQAQVQGVGTPGLVPVWTDSGTLGDSVIIQDGIRIGIGTPDPSARLTIAGLGPYDAPLAARFDLINANARYGYLQHVTDDGTWQIATISAAGNFTRMIITADGNVGIGTVTSDFAKLRVVTDGGSSAPDAIYGSSPGIGVRAKPATPAASGSMARL